MYKRTISLILNTLFLSVFFPCLASASSDLMFSPARGSYLVDEPIPGYVLVKSAEKLSTVEASLEFDPKVLGVEVTNISKNISWVIPPTIDYEKGLISFSGIFSKNVDLEEKLIEVSIIGTRPGSHEIRFLSGASTVAADGTGGNTLGKITNAVYDILIQNGDTGNPLFNSNGEVLGASDTEIIINSPDILDESAWYSLKNIILNWTLPGNINEILTGLSKKSDDLGFKSISNGTTTKIISDIEDGEWYFHITPKGKGLEDTKHFRIAIDTNAPILSTTTEKNREDPHDPNIKYNIEAIDDLSGVDHFEMVLNGGASTRWQDDGSHEYSFYAGSPGDYNLIISAFDRANNRSEAHVNFEVKALPSPLIKLKRNVVPEASPIIAEITGLINASVTVTFEGGAVHHEDTISLDDNGKASYIMKESVLPGNYQLSAVQKLQNGASSISNSHVELVIKPSIIGYIGRHLAVSIALIPVMLLSVFYLMWRFGIIAWYFRKKIDKRVIQKVAPLALMPKRESYDEVKSSRVQTQPLQIKRVVRMQDQNTVIDLRK